MSFSRYSVFLKVVELGSMSRAAVYCNYSQSAVSQIISSLEKELQMTLLNRGQSGIWLTSEGKHMLPYIEKLRDAEEAVYDQSAKLRGIESGHIRIGTFSSVSRHILLPILRDFKKAHPHITIELREGDNLAIESWLMRGTVDFAFMDSPTLPGFEAIDVCHDPFVAVMAESSDYAAMETVPLKIFETAPMILFDENTKKEAAGILHQHKIKPRVEFTSRDDDVVLSLIESDLCLGFMGKLILTEAPFRVVCRPTAPQFYRDIVLTIKDRNAASVAAQRFIEYFEKRLKEAPPAQL